MYKVISIVNNSLVSELSLLLRSMTRPNEYTGVVYSDDAIASDNVSVEPKSNFHKGLETAAVTFFPECDDTLVPYVYASIKANVPVVMFAHHRAKIPSGYPLMMLYVNCGWATKWMRELCMNAEFRAKTINDAKNSLIKLGI